jgi:hypothetical protein
MAALIRDVVDALDLGNVAGTCTRCDVPAGCSSVNLGARGGAVRWSFAGTDGAAIGEARTLAENASIDIPAPGYPVGSRARPGAWTLYLAPAAAVATIGEIVPRR